MERAELAEALSALAPLKRCADALERAAVLLSGALRAGNKVLACGNGGSATQSAHLVTELVVRFARDRDALAAVNLAADAAVLTAAANDLGYERVFARQVEALGTAGDVLVAISTSGRSANVENALAAARSRNVKTVFLGGRRALEADVAVTVDIASTPRVQEAHLILLHALVARVEELLA